MWPFKQKTEDNKPQKPEQNIEMVDPLSIKVSQLDMTEHEHAKAGLSADDWAPTIAINTQMTNPEQHGLPPENAGIEVIYATGLNLSALRQNMLLKTDLERDDGVYCPICHIASIDISKLGTPCPKCNRNLLQFGWE